MKEEIFTIGRLARETGTKVQTIRYYEQISLMPEPESSTGNQRLYERRHIDRLAFIRHSRELGFPLLAIRELLGLVDSPEQTCETADRIARTQLREVELRMVRLAALKAELQRMITECRGGRVTECRVIEVLANHKNCLYDDHLEPA